MKDGGSDQKHSIKESGTNQFQTSKPFLTRGRSPMRNKNSSSDMKNYDNKSNRGISGEKEKHEMPKNVNSRAKSP